MHKKPVIIAGIIILSVSFLFAGVEDNIRNLTGAPTRLVWCQHTGDGKDPFANSTSLKLLGLDTEDGKGIRDILTAVSNYNRPLLTPTGSRVVFSHTIENKVYVVDFTGSNKRFLCNGFATDTWQDPATGQEWVVYQSENSNSAKPVRRCLIDNPATGILVWDKTLVGHCYFQISADGKRGAGAFPWSDCGMAVLNNVSWKKFGDGCWTSITPDNSYIMWIFDGLHRNVQLYDQNGTAKAKIDLHTAPGIRGWEVYHPKWSVNRKNIFSLTGPYSAGSTGSCASNNCGNKISQGGTNVEIYVGKFDAGLTRVAGWVKVTTNPKGDFYPDVWVSTGPVQPDINLSPVRLDFTALPGGSNPANKTVSVTSAGGQSLTGLTATESAGWLAVSISGSGTSRTLTNQVTLGSLGNGTYNTTVTVKAGTITKTYKVYLTIADLHIKMNAGSNNVSGWVSDDAYVDGGKDYTNVQSINLSQAAGPGPVELYHTCRHMGPTFNFRDVPNGTYQVRLHYAEPGDDPDGTRKMIIKIEGTTVESSYNIQAAAGSPKTAIVEEYNVTVSDNNGLTIEYALGTGNDAFVMGIEVIAFGTTGMDDKKIPACRLTVDKRQLTNGLVYTLDGSLLHLKDVPAGIYFIMGKSGKEYHKIIITK